jgi:hypothetical protein
MILNLELDRDIANYRSLTPAQQTRVRADALRRAHALRLAAFRDLFRALVRAPRRLVGAIGMWRRGAPPR